MSIKNTNILYWTYHLNHAIDVWDKKIIDLTTKADDLRTAKKWNSLGVVIRQLKQAKTVREGQQSFYQNRIEWERKSIPY
jgi:hypothetical protein